MTSSPRRACFTLATALVFLAACGTTETGTPTAASRVLSATVVDVPPGSPTVPVPSSTGSVVTEPSAPSARQAPVPDKVVVLDPGHNGGNASNPAEINKKVPAGRGQTKACNTTGTSTNAGYAEHQFTWDVSVRVRDLLTANGIKVVMTRDNDTGVGPCVDRRAAIGNQAGAAAVVSIHADGSNSPGAHGFHIAYSAPPLNPAQGEPAIRLARTLRDGLRSAGFAPSTYIGSDGLSPRADLGGLNLSERPAALVECGNMRNAQEAAVLSSPDGRQRYAAAISSAILAYLA
ncbi:N-acetylmuramoyl-L-alanine amidase [Kibdelosporangium persicum]|uniref:N-acetylmuramoyl-L-alanine amidase AmiA n=1 Tax=Kibdelosporangium persicum TaxID=2698649 RepID=A0ABX2F4R1_9PSEU|nr:N-acetylmuramoyl-L-alanine amidase [Kibdelosporangium persicum]NRN66306.1 N-acetylmuramoyl-L-alanine amidase AmiA [Kibdelosporangium persicum]